MYAHLRARSCPWLGSFTWRGAFFIVLGASTLALPLGDSPSAQAETGEAWVTVDLGPSRVDGLDVAIHHSTVALAHTPPDDEGDGLVYFSCRADCHDRASWRRTPLVAGHHVRHVNLTFDPWGRPHLGYHQGRDLVYATCANSCDRATSWSAVALDRVSSFDRDISGGLSGISLALDSWGRPRIVYIDEDSGGPLKFTSCDHQCTKAGRWSFSHLTIPGAANPAQPELAYVGTQPRIVYARSDASNGLYYATCQKHCLGAEQWRHTPLPVSITSTRSNVGLAVDGPRTRLAVSEDDQPVYLECKSHCSRPDNWSASTVVDTDTYAGHVDLALTPSGPRIAYVRDPGGWLHAGNCEARCTTPDEWKPTAFPALTGPAHIAADGEQLRIASVIYPSDRSPGQLKIALCDEACGAPAAPHTPPHGEPTPSTSTHPTGRGSDEFPVQEPVSIPDQSVVGIDGLKARSSSHAPDFATPTDQTTNRFELRPPNGGPGASTPAASRGSTPRDGNLTVRTDPPRQRPHMRYGSPTDLLVSSMAVLGVVLTGVAAFRVHRGARRIAGVIIPRRNAAG